MNHRFATICAMIGTLAVVATARAESAVFWRHNPITAQAIASDPALAGMQSWSLMTTIDTGRWASVGLRASLPQGLSFYHVPASLGGGFFHPTAPAIALYPPLAYDTYVSAPRNQTGFNPPAILGPFPENDPPMSFGGPSDPAPGRFSVAWGDPVGQSHPLGTYELARWTFSSDAQPTIHPSSFVGLVIPDRLVPIPTALPEPTALTMLIVAMSSLVPSCRMRRPKRR